MLVRLLRGMAIGAGAAFGLALVAPASAHAQAQTEGTRFGVFGAYGDNNVDFGVGAFVKFHLADASGHPITGRGEFSYFFPSYDCGFFADCSASFHYWEASADGLLDIASSGNVKPYVGAGVTLAHLSYSYDFDCGIYAQYCSAGSSKFGLDILGGLNFMANSKLMPFVEAKYELRSGGEFIIKGGVHFK